MLKDILVYLDGSTADATRIAYAEQVARQHDAFVTGLYCNLIPEVLLTGDPGMTAAQISLDMQDTAIRAGKAHAETLETALDKLGINTELRHLDVLTSQAGQTVAAEARRSDLFIATRPYGHDSDHPELMETVLFNSGRGCLFVPPEGAPTSGTGPILVAWRNTREAARAVSEAIPFLKNAEKVIVAIVADDGAPESEKIMPGADISRHLDRHGITVELKQIAGWANPAEALLNEATQIGAEMIVMGGYGHSRFREWVLGGVTRSILSEAQIPVLVAH